MTNRTAKLQKLEIFCDLEKYVVITRLKVELKQIKAFGNNFKCHRKVFTLEFLLKYLQINMSQI